MGFSRLPQYKYILAAGDYCCIIISALIAMNFRPLLLVEENTIMAFIASMLTVAALGIVWLVFMQYFDLYKMQFIQMRSRQIVLLLKSTLYTIIAFSVLSFFIRAIPWTDSRLAILLLFGIAFVLIALWRLVAFKAWWLKKTNNIERKRRVAIIGSNDAGLSVAMQLDYAPDHDLNFVGFISHDSRYAGTGKSLSQFSTLGSIDRLKDITSEYDLDTFLIATDDIEAPELINIAEQCTRLGKQVDIVGSVYNIILEKWKVEEYTGIPVVRLTGAHNNRLVLFIKRCFDIILCSLGLLLISPILISIALIIRFTSKGPIIYKQKRVGENGEEFDFYKFRSMTVDGESFDEIHRKKLYEQYMQGVSEDGKILNVNRITGIGKILRKTSLDELPQLWNVIKGDMSLVGPRPCVPYEYELYSDWQKKRFGIKPGCTGLWQISDRLNISFTDMVLLDFYYINNISPWLDLQIILKTIPVMIFGRGGK